MDLSCFSSYLLDEEGRFSYQKVFQVFCEISAQHRRPYAGLAYHLFSAEALSPLQLQHQQQSAIYSSFPVSSLPLEDKTTTSQQQTSVVAVSSTPSREEQLEAISDDEEEEEEDGGGNSSNDISQQQQSSFSFPSPPSSNEDLHALGFLAPWGKVCQVNGIENLPSSPPALSDAMSHGSWKDPVSSSTIDSQSAVTQKPPILHRLKLVLDLDNTLLHAIARTKIGNVDIKLNHFLDSEGQPEMYKFVLPQLLSQTYYIKLRPGLRRFLREVSEYCDLAIHTNATREYADVIIAILDPDHTLFRGR